MAKPGTVEPTSPRDIRENEFGAAPPFTVGVEEELLLVGPDNELADRSTHILDQTDPDEGGVGTEIFKAMVETRSEISANAAEAIGALRELRGELRDSGARIIGAGVHPSAPSDVAELHQTPRYNLI